MTNCLRAEAGAWLNYPFLTSKERDLETGLDYFLARYYSATQGRFTSADRPWADQSPFLPQSWNIYSYVRNNPCNNIDATGRCTAPAGLRPGQVGICIEAFIAARLFKGVALGDYRRHAGNDPNKTARFTTHIIVSQSSGDRHKADLSQTTTPGVSSVINPAVLITPAISPTISLRGTAETTLNGVGSGPDGSSRTTTAIDGEGVARVNATTNAENGFSAASGVDLGVIRTSINLEVNLGTKEVLVDANSFATEYPSMAIWSFSNVNGTIVTNRVWTQDERSPDALKQAMKPIPDQTQKAQR